MDSSVWIDHLRGVLKPQVVIFRQLLGRELLLVGDLILLEILQGARDDSHASVLETALQRFRNVEMLDRREVLSAARHYRFLRTRGITIRKTVDLIIGTYCIEHGHALLHDDRDFEPMREHLGLQVA